MRAKNISIVRIWYNKIVSDVMGDMAQPVRNEEDLDGLEKYGSGVWNDIGTDIFKVL